MNNVAMIMCHKNPEQVIRLAECCRTDCTDVIIHADSHLNEEDYNKIVRYVKNVCVGGYILL